ncbi:sensor histidine kinase [Candidatus Cryosericum septentrionale]|jgi:PAS domain S-box-containing protein|uniref:histidine kinase n=1 Tax=Candidatus Cryosericum septentrionale TaxID=2290913 RepID=A0A398E3Z5_9BACT|nr:PAS domain-containing sensor histidine kinase [Candidatus Cryosericum septentrionale]RIE17341.1 PAS domain S-box protein [Candidatus Cryosericum septentrionale]
MIRSRPYALRVLSAVLIVASLVFATALMVEVTSVHYQANVGETSHLEASALLLSDRYVAALHASSPAAPLVRGDFPAGLRLTILDAGGSAIADSRFDPGSITNRIADPEVKQAAAGDVGVAVSYRIESGQRERTVCVAIRDSGSLIGFAVASSPVGLTWQSASGTFSWALPLLLVVSSLWLVLALILVRMATRPVSDLADALERRSVQSLAGLAMRADVTELGRAQRASYALLQESEVLIEREHLQSSALSAVLDAVPQAIAILDSTGAVLSANTQFDQFVGADALPVAGRHIAELITLPECLAAIDRCVSEHQPQTVAAEDHGRYYSCSVHELDGKAFRERRALVVLEDITDAMTLPRIKADFVTNASHELKTPLTAIRGYLELLREEPGNAHYLDIVQRNVDRLIALSSDISLLSRLENRAPEIELVDVSKLQHDLAELFDKQGHETGVALRFSVDSEGRFLYGDRLMLLQMFINLIENAYHFTQTGTITVSATTDVSHIILSVSDTGQGIPARDLPRIFERFYSHASDHGRPGTGLGLAIVKRIVLAHNGTIDVESTVNKGTTFVIHIPKNLGPRRPAATSGQPSDTKREDL